MAAETSFTFANLIEHPVTRRLADAFEANSDHPLYLVGGCVRDCLDGKSDFADLDFTTSARPDEIEKILEPLGELWIAGKRFGTVGVFLNGQKVEVTTFRSDAYDPGSRKPEVQFADSLFFDLVRRDFTVNAMAIRVTRPYDPAPIFHDAFNGQRDLRRGELITPGDPVQTLTEDPLRIVRAIRFCATKGFVLSEPLREAIYDTKTRLSIVAVERIMEEMRKIVAHGSDAVRIAWKLARDLGVGLYLFGPLAHPNRDPIGGLHYLAEYDVDGVLAMAYIAACHSHRPDLSKLRLAGDEIDAIERIVTMARGAAEVGNIVDARVLVRSEKVVLDLEGGLGVAQALGSVTERQLELIQEASNDYRIHGPLPVNGNDLIAAGIPEGPKIGLVLRAIERLFVLDPAVDKEFCMRYAEHLERSVL